ncbi:hypothetical protein HMI55_005267, partial [Coelomomyces lativittatus]
QQETGLNRNRRNDEDIPVHQEVPQNPVPVEVHSQPQQNSGNCMDLGVGRCFGEGVVNTIHTVGNGLLSLLPKWW